MPRGVTASRAASWRSTEPMEALAEAPLFWDIYEEHLDEAEFLWSQREHALLSTRHQLWELERVEKRLLARVDGLAIGGPAVAAHLLVPALEAQVPARISTAALALLTGEFQQPDGAVLALLQGASPPQAAALSRALGLLDRQTLVPWIETLLGTGAPLCQEVALSLPISSEVIAPGVLAQLSTHDDPQVCSAALRALARAGAHLERGWMLRLLNSPHPGLREAAIEAGLITGHRTAWEACLAAITLPGSTLCRLWVAMLGDERHLESLRALLDRPSLRRDVLWALGFSGHVFGADICIEFMREAPLAALAAEAFCSITGLQLTGAYVAARPPAPEEPIALADENLEMSLALSAEQALPLPDVSAISQWWAEHRSRMDPRHRYLRGTVLSWEALFAGLENEPLRRRHSLALEVVLRSRGRVSIPTRAFVHRQASILRAARDSLSMTPWVHPLAEGLTA